VTREQWFRIFERAEKVEKKQRRSWGFGRDNVPIRAPYSISKALGGNRLKSMSDLSHLR